MEKTSALLAVDFSSEDSPEDAFKAVPAGVSEVFDTALAAFSEDEC